MEGVWFAIVTTMLAVYAVLDGFDFGVGLVAPAWSPELTLSDGPSSPPSALSGMGTRCGWSPAGGVLVFAVIPTLYSGRVQRGSTCPS